MDAAAPSRRAGPMRGRPLIPPNYVSLRDLQELRLREKEERRRREQEEEAAAAARRAEEEGERRRKEEEEASAARRAKEEERRRRQVEEEEAAARRVRDAATAPRQEMRGSSSSRAPFRYNDRNRGGPRVVVGPHRPPPPPRGEGSAVSSGGAAVDSRGKKGPGDGAVNGTLGGGGKAWSEGKGKASAGLIAGPAEPATVSSLGGKPEENSKGEEATGYDGTALGMSSTPGKLTKADTASYRGRARPNYRGNGRKGLDGRSTETSMTGVTNEAVEALPPPALDSENKGKNGLNNQSIGTASVSPPGEATEASPLQGVKSDKKWRKKKKPSGGRQAGAAPSSDWPNGSGEKPCRYDEGSHSRRNGDGQGTIWEAKSEGLGGKQTEVEGKVYSHRPTESSSNRRSDSGQGMTRKANEDLGEKQLVVKMKAQPHPAADSNNCRRSNGDQEMNQEAESEGFEDNPTVVVMRATTQLQPCNVRNSRGRRYSGAHSRANSTARQHSSVWVPKAAAVPVRAEVGNIP